MKIFRFGFWTLVTAVLMIGTVTPLAAASGDVFVQAGVVNIGDGGGTHALVGGGGSGMIGGHLAIFGELNYVPTGDFGLSTSEIGISTRMILAGGGVRVYIPTGSKLVRLYVLGAGGMNRWTATATVSNVSISASANGGYFGAGFGAEIGHKFGVRPEFRYARSELSFAGMSASYNTISVTAGVFYRFGGK